ncbi:MAG: hypothetical protein AAF433_06875 [Bacteroidota bacterium]
MSISTPSAYYEESGSITPARLSLGLLLIVTIAIVFGYIYALIMYFSPLVYINALVCIGMGLLLGFTANFAGRVAHLRSTAWRIGFAAFAGLLAYLCHWCAYLPMVFNDGLSPAAYLSTLSGLFNPGGLWVGAKFLNTLGVWEIASMPNTGFFGQLIWLVEAVIIIGLPVYFAWRAKVHPYSEQQQRFYQQYLVPVPYFIPSPSLFVKAIQEEGFAAFSQLEEPRANLFHLINLYYLQGENRHYLDVTKVSISNSGKEQKTTETVVVDNLAIDTTTAKQIINELGAKQQTKASLGGLN